MYAKVRYPFFLNLPCCYRPHSEGMGRVLFSQMSVSPNYGGGGHTPIQSTGSTPVHQDSMEVALLPPPIKTEWGMGVPPPPMSGLDGGTTPSRLDGGTPLSGLGGGTTPPPPPPPIRRQSSRVSTCYAVGGMPLAFTQEDFLVYHCKKWPYKLGLTVRCFRTLLLELWSWHGNAWRRTLDPHISGRHTERSCVSHINQSPFYREKGPASIHSSRRCESFTWTLLWP